MRCQFCEEDNRRGLGFDKPEIEYNPDYSSVAVAPTVLGILAIQVLLFGLIRKINYFSYLCPIGFIQHAKTGKYIQ
jgi:hypothetical protein